MAVSLHSTQLQHHAVLDRLEARLRTLDKKKEGMVVRAWEESWACDILETPEYAAFRESYENAEGGRNERQKRQRIEIVSPYKSIVHSSSCRSGHRQGRLGRRTTPMASPAAQSWRTLRTCYALALIEVRHALQEVRCRRSAAASLAASAAQAWSPARYELEAFEVASRHGLEAAKLPRTPGLRGA